MYTLFFDTETTGFPKRAGWDEYFDPKQLKAYDSSRVVSISWIIRNTKTNFIKAEYFIVNPEGFVIDNEGRACQVHGITQEKATTEGKHMSNIIEQLTEDIAEYKPKLLVGHNVKFDYHIVLSEIYRCMHPSGYELRADETEKFQNLYDTFSATKRYCTMENGKDFARILTWKMGDFKPPKLSELYHELFREKFEAHDAYEDTKACMRCYYKMVEDIDVNQVVSTSGGV